MNLGKLRIEITYNVNFELLKENVLVAGFCNCHLIFRKLQKRSEWAEGGFYVAGD